MCIGPPGLREHQCDPGSQCHGEASARAQPRVLVSACVPSVTRGLGGTGAELLACVPQGCSVSLPFLWLRAGRMRSPTALYWRKKWRPAASSCLENPTDRGASGLQSMGSQRIKTWLFFKKVKVEFSCFILIEVMKC